jgi:phage terminase large subunit-like protein
MVRSNLLAVDPRVPVRLVHASRGKDVRAEPVSTRYSEGRVHHVGHFPELEAEMTGWVPGDPESPNRLDAGVWVVTELLPPTTERNFDPKQWKRVYA